MGFRASQRLAVVDATFPRLPLQGRENRSTLDRMKVMAAHTQANIAELIKSIQVMTN